MSSFPQGFNIIQLNKNSVLPPVACHSTLLRHPPTMICSTPGQCCQVLVAPPLAHFHWPTQKCGHFADWFISLRARLPEKIRWAHAQFENPIRAGTTEGVKKGEERRSICDGACRRQGDGLKRRRYSENNGDLHGRSNHKNSCSVLHCYPQGYKWLE